jgi:citronellol/citronellal dehydrogenase
MFQETLFAGKIVLVTGGGSGIGFAIAESFLKSGAAHVFIASRKAERLEGAVQELSKYGKCTALTLDIREINQIEAVVETIKSTTGRLDILINNAGGQFPSVAENISIKGWNAVINTNLNGTWYVTKTMFEHFFEAQGGGTIVNIIANIYRGFAGMSHTGAARAGVDNLTKTLAVEWARRGVRINAVAPGIIQSSGLDNYPPELLVDLTNKIPMKKLGTTQEVANTVLFLASDAVGFLTGETVYIDGGQRLWGDIWQYD